MVPDNEPDRLPRICKPLEAPVQVPETELPDWVRESVTVPDPVESVVVPDHEPARFTVELDPDEDGEVLLPPHALPTAHTSMQTRALTRLEVFTFESLCIQPPGVANNLPNAAASAAAAHHHPSRRRLQADVSLHFLV